MRIKRAPALAAVLIAAAGIAFLLHIRTRRARAGEVAADAADTTGAAAAETGATVFGAATFVRASLEKRSATAVPRLNPYAVVPHGICVPGNDPHQQEASRKKWEALIHDPLWQSIYSGVDPEQFHLVRTAAPLHRYVTYWKAKHGQLIHWTGKQILIPAGTRVFTDGLGTMYLCACGNQVATVVPPQKGTTVLAPDEEPPVASLVPPEPDPFAVLGRGMPESPLGPPLDVISPDLGTDIPPEPGSLLPLTPGPPEWPPLLPIFPPPVVGGAYVPPPSGSGPGSAPVPPPVVPPVVPEPDTFSLALIGLAAGAIARRIRRR